MVILLEVLVVHTRVGVDQFDNEPDAAEEIQRVVLGLKISYGTMQPLKATISNNEYDPHYEYLDTANAKN